MAVAAAAVQAEQHGQQQAAQDVITSRVHARVGLLGNPSDGYHGKTLSFALANFWAEVRGGRCVRVRRDRRGVPVLSGSLSHSSSCSPCTSQWVLPPAAWLLVCR
jgi:hypothetical protein